MATKNIDIIIQAKDLASKSIKNIQWSLWWIWETVKTASKYISWLTAWVVIFWLKSAWNKLELLLKIYIEVPSKQEKQ